MKLKLMWPRSDELLLCVFFHLKSDWDSHEYKIKKKMNQKFKPAKKIRGTRFLSIVSVSLFNDFNVRFRTALLRDDALIVSLNIINDFWRRLTVSFTDHHCRFTVCALIFTCFDRV